MTEAPANKIRTQVSIGEKGFYRVEIEGEASATALSRVVGEIADFPDSQKELWVATNIKLDLSNTEIIKLADLAKQMNMRPNKLAIVASNDLNFGLARIYAAHRETEENRLTVFRNEESALEWLELDHDTATADRMQQKAWKEHTSLASSQ